MARRAERILNRRVLHYSDSLIKYRWDIGEKIGFEWWWWWAKMMMLPSPYLHCIKHLRSWVEEGGLCLHDCP